MLLPQIKKKIKAAMERKGYNPASLAKEAGLGNTAVRDILNNEEQDVRIQTLEKICRTLEISLGSLFSDDVLIQDGSIIVHELDVRASAGHGANNGREDIEAAWAIPRAYLETMSLQDLSSLRIIQVQGDSMAPEYRPGDRILVDTSQRKPADGDFVLTDGFDNLLVKKLQVVAGTAPPRLKVISTNKQYDSYELAAADIHINGKVVGKWDWR